MSAPDPDRSTTDATAALVGAERKGTRLQLGPLLVYVLPGGLLGLVLFLGGMCGGILTLLRTAGLTDTSPVQTGAGVGVAYLGIILLHEAGHGVTARACGARIRWVRFSARSGVILDRVPRGRHRLLISAAGPGTELLTGLSLLALSSGLGVAAVTGGLAALNGAVGLLVPLRADSDGRKLWRGIAETLRGAPPEIVLPAHISTEA